jgi:hypothetical protein
MECGEILGGGGLESSVEYFLLDRGERGALGSLKI